MNPYKELPSYCFWRTGVAEKSPFDLDFLYKPKYFISKKSKIITAGSCFAQHFSKALTKNGYVWFNAETAPPLLSESSKKVFNYDVFSFRTGNIYTPALLHQWLVWAFGLEKESDEVWENDGRYYDPIRPAIEPNGFSSAEEMLSSRNATLKSIKRAFERADVFVFTLGLTEAWYNSDSGLKYAVCPGTIAGEFDANMHKFINYDYVETKSYMDRIVDILLNKFPNLKILLTVSPVPLTASADTTQHVISSTTYSKSVLRAVAGKISESYDHVDYFPSYEVINSTPFKGMFFAPNQRSVVPKGVEIVMSHFFSNMIIEFPEESNLDVSASEQATDTLNIENSAEEDVACEELMLELENGN